MFILLTVGLQLQGAAPRLCQRHVRAGDANHGMRCMVACYEMTACTVQTVCVQNQPISNCRDLIGRIIVH